MKKILLFAFIFSISQAFSQRNNAWSILGSEATIKSEKIRNTTYSENQQLLQFNFEVMKQALAQVADKASGQPGVEILVPNVQGEMERFLVWESSNFEPGLQAKYPQIRAYVGKGITDPSAVLHFSFDPKGIQTMIFRGDSETEFIEPYTKDHSVYVLFDSKTRTKANLPFNCKTEDVELNQALNKTNLSVQSSAQVYKTMRLALSCTGEYTTYFGGTVEGALAGMNASMTRVNGIYERDLAVKLLIIANTDSVIFTDGSTDPYDDADLGTGNSASNGYVSTWNAQLQSTLTSTLGDSAYDIGHLFGASGGGGNAGCIGCVCVAGSKGSGFTSPYDGIPAGDTFDIDYVAHEMGHQLGANHTFSHTTENNSVNVEPGSGSTIMGYAGITGSTDVQAHSDDYFAYKSINQIQSNLNSKTCPISYNSSSNPAFTNVKPTVSAGPDYSIPIGTAFKLTGTASDSPNEVLTYCWEQNDDASLSSSLGSTGSFPSPTKTNGPNFRSRKPVLTNVRYMPQLSDVLAGNLTTTWETVSTVSRTLNFALTVRDNVLFGGQTNTDAMVVTVNANAGPFVVTSQNTTGINWPQGSSQTITWNVANTTILTGSANVNIKLSTDGGLNYDTVLASNTPNDGSETITVPNISALNCRILIEPTANIYCAVNSKAFSIGANCYTYSTTPNAAIADATASNTAGAVTTSVINVPDNITISNMKINLKINHARIGDLVVKISHPDGTTRTLWNRTCNSATYAGIDITFADGTGSISCASPATGTHNASQSASALAGYNGKTSQGNWTLTVTDNNPNNTGTLVSWGLDFGCTLANNTYEISDLAIYPNPNKGNFNIQFSNAASNDIKVNVFDMSGRKIFENNYSSQATFNENIQLNNAAAGVYLVSVTDGTRKMVKRIIVE
ncbi:T9SS type A sorting domain-containing protein [Flavobacterium silvisoli]|uniref:T9SS type A sorting domain-containing protein n=1 Tax=Flavobacterium silvisoli TaxID=2529433 RepID=A0A4Q9Z966_9FLAO|nr:zinc-dependent metalloprotease family protein [Flavobacterium silvisoli]TBX70717.1 T9SS type A sorting domain-containing protein [Flavobacterium silvisoli]